jgi:hypothetical protein
LLVLGRQQFGEVYYLGKSPLAEHDGLVDVLVGIHDVTETQFYFDPQSGHLAALEMYPDPERDPCEIHFSDYREVSGREVPQRMTVRFGDVVFAELVVSQIRFEGVAAAEA